MWEAFFVPKIFIFPPIEGRILVEGRMNNYQSSVLKKNPLPLKFYFVTPPFWYVSHCFFFFFFENGWLFIIDFFLFQIIETIFNHNKFNTMASTRPHYYLNILAKKVNCFFILNQICHVDTLMMSPFSTQCSTANASCKSKWLEHCVSISMSNLL